MKTLEAELDEARALDVSDLADSIEAIGFECTRCGACCKGTGGEEDGGDGGDGDEDGASGEEDAADGEEFGADEHTAAVFPDEVRDLQAATDYDWRDVARPTPFGLRENDDGDPEGETFEWALQTDACGDCTFYEETGGVGNCTVHANRPRICRTYPFSVALGGANQPMGEAVDEEGLVRAHECEGLGRDVAREDAEDLAAALKERAVTELEEAIAVRDGHEPADPGPGEVVVHDSEGAKRPDGTALDDSG